MNTLDQVGVKMSDDLGVFILFILAAFLAMLWFVVAIIAIIASYKIGDPMLFIAGIASLAGSIAAGVVLCTETR